MKLTAPIFQLKRQARAIARAENIPHHAALDRLAKREGFSGWSHLSATIGKQGPAQRIFSKLTPRDVMLLGARPGHGKTLLGLELAALAAQARYRSYFFTLDYTESDVWRRLESLGLDPVSIRPNLVVDASDDICAAYIEAAVDAGDRPPFIVMDYLQLLDQRRDHPALDHQLAHLRRLALSQRAIVVLLSQINRRFNAGLQPVPRTEDIRMPNPFDPSVFTVSCFMHDGQIHLNNH